MRHLLSSIWLFLIPFLTLGQDSVEPCKVYRKIVKDSAVIEHFRSGQLITSDLAIDSIEVIDGNGNGFGMGDLIILYPSKNIQALLTVEEPLKSIMAAWKPDVNKTFSSSLTESYQVFQIAEEWQSPFPGLLTFILKGLELYYPKGERIQGFFRKDPETSYIELWGYDEKELRYRPLEGLGISDTLEAYDVIHVVTRDTVYLADSTLFDAIYIYRTYSDTLILPPAEP